MHNISILTNDPPTSENIIIIVYSSLVYFVFMCDLFCLVCLLYLTLKVQYC